MPINDGQWWGRWGSHRIAAEYMAHTPNFVLTRECSLPWPFGGTKVMRKMVSLYYEWPASVSEYFTRETPTAGAPEPSVGSKRARIEMSAVGHCIKTAPGIRKPTRCQKWNVSEGAGGDIGGKELAICLE